MARIVVADDDGHIREVVKYALEQAGHSVLEARDGAEALALVRQSDVDLAVLDIVMPEDSGLELCRKIRAHSSLPIVFVSSRDEELDRVLGLELGADDYITKPFSPRELVARVGAVLRRVRMDRQPPEGLGATRQQPSVHGPLEVDLERHRCSYHGRQIALTVTELGLLATLVQAPGRVLSRQQLVERVYGRGHFITERTVDSHIRRVRSKLSGHGPDPIETVYGAGYRMREVLE
ncbi:MAG: response regulator transcription factor [Proteobacteria bacterium]|nr:response regulator transcription factor [Pseudomonadota bacterium]